MIKAGPDDTPPGHDPGHRVLLVRRHRYTGELSFYRCPPPPAGLADLVAVGCTRWRIDLAVAAALHRDGHAGPETGLIPITVFLNAWWVTEPISFERR